MDGYMEEALAIGYKWFSTLPSAAAFFFVNKKDGGLQPCIDLGPECYHGPLSASPSPGLGSTRTAAQSTSLY